MWYFQKAIEICVFEQFERNLKINIGFFQQFYFFNV